jgi:hypothetical protein
MVHEVFQGTWIGHFLVLAPSRQHSDGLDFRQVAEVARDLVNCSIERLDSVNLSKVL